MSLFSLVLTVLVLSQQFVVLGGTLKLFCCIGRHCCDLWCVGEHEEQDFLCGSFLFPVFSVHRLWSLLQSTSGLFAGIEESCWKLFLIIIKFGFLILYSGLLQVERLCIWFLKVLLIFFSVHQVSLHSCLTTKPKRPAICICWPLPTFALKSTVIIYSWDCLFELVIDVSFALCEASNVAAYQWYITIFVGVSPSLITITKCILSCLGRTLQYWSSICVHFNRSKILRKHVWW